MENQAEKQRVCLVTYRISDGPIRTTVLGALEDQSLEGLNLMLAWRKLLAGTSGVKTTDINILNYVDLYGSAQAQIDI